MSVYTGASLTSLSELAGGNNNEPVTFRGIAGTTYYLQLGRVQFSTGTSTVLGLQLEVSPLPTASFFLFPSDPSIFDNVQFVDLSSDPARVGIKSESWDFGDRTPVFHRRVSQPS